MCAAKVAAPQINNNNFKMLMKIAGGYMTRGKLFLRQL
jgi:hypothetical protein